MSVKSSSSNTSSVSLAALRAALDGSEPGSQAAVAVRQVRQSHASTSLLVSSSQSFRVSPAHVDQLHNQGRCTLAAADSARAPITFLGIGAVPARPRIHFAPTSDWILTPLEDDPLYRTGRFPIPSKERRHLTRLNRRGVHMDALLVAHEIPKNLAPSTLPVSSSQSEGPIEIDPALLPALITHPGPAPSTRRFAATAGQIAGAVGRVAGVAASVAAAARRGLVGSSRVRNSASGRSPRRSPRLRARSLGVVTR